MGNVTYGVGEQIPERNTKKRVIIGVVIAVLLITAVVLPLTLMSKSDEPAVKKDESVQPKVVGNLSELKPEGPVEQSSAKAASGDYAGAQQILDDALKSEKDADERHELLTQKANNAINAGKYSDALTYTEQAKQTVDSFKANVLIGRIYERMGQPQSAIAPYQKALELIKDDPNYDNDQILLEEKLKTLQS